MNVIIWFILIIISLAVLLKIPDWKLQYRKSKWRKEEENCQIYDVLGSRDELWHYADSERKLSVSIAKVDSMRIAKAYSLSANKVYFDNGFGIYMDGFADTYGKISIEDNKIIAARMLKYLGFVRGVNTLKLIYRGSVKPSDELIKQIENKIKPFGYVRTNQGKNDEITWLKN